jgi:hypothetical protein
MNFHVPLSLGKLGRRRWRETCVGHFTMSTASRSRFYECNNERRTMIKTGPRLATYFVILSLVVAAGIAYGLLGEQLGMRTVYHSPENSSGSSGK